MSAVQIERLRAFVHFTEPRSFRLVGRLYNLMFVHSMNLACPPYTGEAQNPANLP